MQLSPALPVHRCRRQTIKLLSPNIHSQLNMQRCHLGNPALFGDDSRTARSSKRCRFGPIMLVVKPGNDEMSATGEHCITSLSRRNLLQQSYEPSGSSPISDQTRFEFGITVQEWSRLAFELKSAALYSAARAFRTPRQDGVRTIGGEGLPPPPDGRWLEGGHHCLEDGEAGAGPTFAWMRATSPI